MNTSTILQVRVNHAVLIERARLPNEMLTNFRGRYIAERPVALYRFLKLIGACGEAKLAFEPKVRYSMVHVLYGFLLDKAHNHQPYPSSYMAIARRLADVAFDIRSVHRKNGKSENLIPCPEDYHRPSANYLATLMLADACATLIGGFSFPVNEVKMLCQLCAVPYFRQTRTHKGMTNEELDDLIAIPF